MNREKFEAERALRISTIKSEIRFLENGTQLSILKVELALAEKQTYEERTERRLIVN